MTEKLRKNQNIPQEQKRSALRGEDRPCAYLFFHTGQNGLDPLCQGQNVLLRGIPAQGHPEELSMTSSGRPMATSTWLRWPLAPGGSGGDADPRVLQKIQGVLGGDPGQGQGENVGGLMGTVDPNALHGAQPFHGQLQKPPLPGGILFKGGPYGLTGGAETENPRRSLCAAAILPLLAAAQQQGRQRQPGPNVQGAHALGPRGPCGRTRK